MIPYDVIGFVVFWLVAPIAVLAVGFALLAYLRKLLLNQLQVIDKKLWCEADYNKGEYPDGWRHRASFYNHVLICLLSFRTPIQWRWSSYKKKLESE